LKTSYELWCLSSANWAGNCDSLEEVLDSFAETAKEFCPNEAEDYGLIKYVVGKEVDHFQPEELVDLVAKHIQSLA
jgi:hypothetical protein